MYIYIHTYTWINTFKNSQNIHAYTHSHSNIHPTQRESTNKYAADLGKW